MICSFLWSAIFFRSILFFSHLAWERPSLHAFMYTCCCIHTYIQHDEIPFFRPKLFCLLVFPHSSQLYCIFFSFWLRNVTIFFEFMAAMPFVHCININYRAQSTLMLQLISSMNIKSISLARSIVFSLYLNQYFHFSIQSKLIIIFFKIHLLFVDPRTLTLLSIKPMIQSYDNSSEIFANWVEF